MTRRGLRLGALAAALFAAGCGAEPELTLRIRVPVDDQDLFRAVTRLSFTASRDGVVLAQSAFSPDVESISLAGVSHGPRTVIALEGVDPSEQIIAKGQTCPIDFKGPDTVASLYFAPTNFFAPAAGPPGTVRAGAAGAALGDGSVLLVGGSDPDGNVLGTGELFDPGSATFRPLDAGLTRPRVWAQAVTVPNVGLLVVGGMGEDGSPIAEAELYLEAQRRLVSVEDPRIDPRIGHRVVVLADGSAFVTGGTSASGALLATTIFISVLDDGTYRAMAGPPLLEARREHAATVAVGVPIVFGGYDASGAPLDTIEAIDLAGSYAEAVGRMRSPRAEATATVLDDGAILLVGGVDATGMPRADAELYNPITRSTTVFPLAFSRRGHSATRLPDGRVMIAGGRDEAGHPVAEVELFAPAVGFVSERPLVEPRVGHLTVPLCDETVLVVGGGEGAEIYSGPARVR